MVTRVITTITCIVDLEFTIHLENLVYFLPVNKGFKKIQDGDLILVKFGSYSKGILPYNKRPFRNSITISMVYDKKIISVKIFRNKLQICGVNSDDAIEFSVQRILNHIRRIQNSRLEMNIYTLSFLNNFPQKENAFQSIKEMKNVMTGDSMGYRVNKVMLNYKCDLQYNISKSKVLKIFQSPAIQGSQEQYKFLVSYQNASDFSVYIVCRDKQNNFICYLIVYKSGLITQSGRNQEKMNEVMRRFLEILEGNKREIFLNTKRKIVYKTLNNEPEIV
jgi:hypothetical protein